MEDVRNLYIEHYKMLREIKWRGLWMKRLSITKMSILHKLKMRFNEIPIKI